MPPKPRPGSIGWAVLTSTWLIRTGLTKAGLIGSLVAVFVPIANSAESSSTVNPSNPTIVKTHQLAGRRLYQTIETCESPIYTENNRGEDVALPSICKTGSTPNSLQVTFEHATAEVAANSQNSLAGQLANQSFELHLRPYRTRTPERVCFYDRLVDIEAGEWPRISFSHTGLVSTSPDEEHQVQFQLVARVAPGQSVKFTVAPPLSEYRGPASCQSGWNLASDSISGLTARISGQIIGQ